MKAIFGISLSHGGAQVQEAARAFAARLAARSAIDVQLSVEDDYDALFAALQAGRVSMAWLPPLLYSRAAVESLHLVAVPQRGGGVAIYSAVLVRADSTLADAAELRGARAAWVDKSSSTGYAFPRQHLLGLGASLSTETFHGSPNVAASEVLAGRADLCTCPVSGKEPGEIRRNLAAVLGHGSEQLRVLTLTGMISPDGVAVSRAAPAEVTSGLSAAVLAMHEDSAGVAALQGLFRAERMLTPADSARRMMATAG